MGGMAGLAAWVVAAILLLPPAPPPVITGDVATDDLIRSLAEARGYARSDLFAGDLVDVGAHRLTSEAAAAWERLEAAAADAGHRLRIVAAFRDIDTQRSLFLRRLSGPSEAAIGRTLRWTAPPGYSKHHTGRAVDLTVAGSTAGRFGSSAAYSWLTADSNANARRFGFTPSYPPGSQDGPNPERWEWIYVGVAEPRRPVE